MANEESEAERWEEIRSTRAIVAALALKLENQELAQQETTLHHADDIVVEDRTPTLAMHTLAGSKLAQSVVLILSIKAPMMNTHTGVLMCLVAHGSKTVTTHGFRTLMCCDKSTYTAIQYTWGLVQAVWNNILHDPGDPFYQSSLPEALDLDRTQREMQFDFYFYTRWNRKYPQPHPADEEATPHDNTQRSSTQEDTIKQMVNRIRASENTLCNIWFPSEREHVTKYRRS